MTNCKNCGAPLHGWKCIYCDTEYPELKPAEVNYRIMPAHSNTFSITRRLSPYALRGCTAKDIGPRVKRDMVEDLSKELVQYCGFETWVDSETLEQVLGMHVTVVSPEYIDSDICVDSIW